VTGDAPQSAEQQRVEEIREELGRWMPITDYITGTSTWDSSRKRNAEFLLAQLDEARATVETGGRSIQVMIALSEIKFQELEQRSARLEALVREFGETIGRENESWTMPWIDLLARAAQELEQGSS